MGTETATEIDRTAVIGVVLDYFEGWFSGDAARMERALHPELCKRSFARDPDGTERLPYLLALVASSCTADESAKDGSG